VSDQLDRLRATWALWSVVLFITVNLTSYGWVAAIARHAPACIAASIVMIVAGVAVHACNRSVCLPIGLFIGGVLFGSSLGIGWEVSGGLAKRHSSGDVAAIDALPTRLPHRTS
jgi:hypothetical protein